MRIIIQLPACALLRNRTDRKAGWQYECDVPSKFIRHDSDSDKETPAEVITFELPTGHLVAKDVPAFGLGIDDTCSRQSSLGASTNLWLRFLWQLELVRKGIERRWSLTLIFGETLDDVSRLPNLRAITSQEIDGCYSDSFGNPGKKEAGTRVHIT